MCTFAVCPHFLMSSLPFKENLRPLQLRRYDRIKRQFKAQAQLRPSARVDGAIKCHCPNPVSTSLALYGTARDS
jgi:hypothetical protein